MGPLDAPDLLATLDVVPLVVEYPCKMVGRGRPEGSIWYSFTAEGQTIGVSLEPGRSLVGEVIEVDEQRLIVLHDVDPEAILYEDERLGPIRRVAAVLL